VRWVLTLCSLVACAPDAEAPATVRDLLRDALGDARAQETHVLLEVLGDGADARELRRAMGEPEVEEALARYVRVSLEPDAEVREVLEDYGAAEVPAWVVLDGHGRCVGRTAIRPVSENVPMRTEQLVGWLDAPGDHSALRAWPEPEEEPEVLFPAEL